MSIKLRIKNFQSLADVSLEAEGFTVITGASNLGKTALARAISGAVWGIPGDYYVRHGSTGAAVRMVDPNLDLTWKKVPKPQPGLQTMLRINGTDHTKLGRDHSSLTAPHGFKEIVTTAKTFRPQVAYQHDPIFLITEGETTVAEVFKQLGRTDVITHAQNAAGKDRRSKELTAKVREGDIEKTKTEMEELNVVQDLVKLREKARSSVQEFKDEEERSSSLLEKLRRLQEIQPNPISATLPKVESAEDLMSQVTRLRRLIELSPRTVTNQLPEVNPIPPTYDLLGKLVQLKKSSEDEAKEREKTELDLSSIVGEIKKLEDELGYCPQCGRKL